MKKKTNISDAERAEFHQAMGELTPIKQDKHKPQSKKPPAKRQPYRDITPKHVAHCDDYLAKLSEDDWISGQDCIHFARSGLQSKVVQKLKRGQIPIQARIDLHRKTGHEALQLMQRFITLCQMQGKRWVLVVHGKGLNKPVIKNLLNHWLREQPEVLGFHSASAKDGGSGALYVLLKLKG